MVNVRHPSALLIISECKKHGLLRNQAAYCLATAHHETGVFKWMREIWGPTAAQKRYEGRKDLGNTVRGDGKRFMGRGFVQITGRRNYTDWSKRLGIDLVANPSLAERPEYAARILVEGSRLGTFTGKKLSDYITLTHSDFKGARRIINGTDRAAHIANIAWEYDAALKASGYGDGPIKPAPKPTPAQKPVDRQSSGAGAKTLIVLVSAILAALWAKFDAIMNWIGF